MTDDYIIKSFKNKIEEKGMTYTFVSKKAEIEYQRLMRIFNQNAVLTAKELLKLCDVLGMSPDVFRDWQHTPNLQPTGA